MIDIQEICNIGQAIISNFQDLEFDEPSHTYTVKGVKHTSVSKMIETLAPHFDDVSGSISYADKRGMDSIDVLKAWRGENNLSTTFGHQVHKFAEDYAIYKYFHNKERVYPSNLSELAAVQWFHDMIDTPGYLVPVVVELPMYHKDFPIAGTTDNLLYDTRDKTFLIHDWKGLALSTPILTSDGWKTMGSIKEGDKVYDKDGNLTKVIHTSKAHFNPCFKIEFDTNDTIICDNEHKWLVTLINQSGVEIERVMDASEIYDWTSKNKRYSSKILRIKTIDNLQNNKIELPIDPYVLGVWLADGNPHCGMITNMCEQVWTEIESRGFSLGHNVTPQYTAAHRTVFGLRNKLNKLNLLQNKHLPDLYLKASFEQRLDLLRGLMDGDGHYNIKRKRCSMQTTKLWQAKACMQLVSSLGWKPTLFEFTKKSLGKDYKVYDVCFRPKANPFLSRNKNCMDNSYPKDDIKVKYRVITKIEKVPTVATRCIGVDSPSHTYVVGDNFITTHNTNKDLFKPPFNNMLKPFSNFPDNPIHHYYIQLSFYQLMLERIGLPIKARVITWLKKDNETGKLYKNFRCPNLTVPLHEYLTSYFN